MENIVLSTERSFALSDFGCTAYTGKVTFEMNLGKSSVSSRRHSEKESTQIFGRFKEKESERLFCNRENCYETDKTYLRH